MNTSITLEIDIPSVHPPPSLDFGVTNIASLPAKPHRYVVVDSLRGIAILGMIWAHAKGLAPQMFPDPVMGVFAQLSGAATPLFMLVAGTTIAILTHRKMNQTERLRFRLEYLLRGIGLIILGLLLLQWAGRVDIVLAYLGVTFILAVPFFFLDSKWLVMIAATAFMTSPLIMRWLRLILIAQPELLYSHVSSHPLAFLIEWTFTGRSYHATWLLPFLLLGIVCGRLLIKNKFPARLLLGGNLLITGIVYVSFVYPQNSAGTFLLGGYPEMIYDIGRASIIYGAGISLFSSHRIGIRRAVVAISAPATLAGRMPLTLYVFHVFLLFAIEHSGVMTTVPTPIWPFVVLASSFGVAALWGLTLGTGPVERALGVLSLRHPPSWLLRLQPIVSTDLGFESLPRALNSSRR